MTFPHTEGGGGGGSGGGVWEVMASTLVTSATATVDFTTGIDNTYNTHILDISDLRGDTDNVHLVMRFSNDGGASWRSGASDYTWAGYGKSAGVSFVDGGSQADTQIRLSPPGQNIAFAGAGDVLRAIIFMSRLADPAYKPEVTAEVGHYRGAASDMSLAHAAGGSNVAETIDGVRMLLTTGNIVAGRFTLYGIKHA